MKYHPNIAVGDLQFGSDQGSAILIFGKPKEQNAIENGNIEMRYNSYTLRFHPKSGFCECTGQWDELDLGSFAIPTTSLDAYLKHNDPDARDLLGFIVSRKYGIAHEYEQMQTTLFRPGSWDHLIESSQQIT